MVESNSFYFRQLLSGVDFATTDSSARQMGNYVYLMGDTNTRECVVVDPAYDIDGILKIVEQDEMKLVGALATHYHPDHVGGTIFGMNIMGLPALLEKNSVPIYVNKLEADGVQQVTGISATDMKKLESEDKVKVGDFEITCLHTPGHTPGSQCFRIEDCLIAGDTLFLQGCGRVDLPGGNSEDLYYTLTQRLAKIQDEIVLYPGHRYGPGGSASMGEVRQTNHYLQISSVEDWFSVMGRPGQ